MVIRKDKSLNSRHVRRFLRQIKLSSEKLNNKERIKKLSPVSRCSLSNKENYEMGCDVVEKGDAPSTSVRLISSRAKLAAKQSIDDCNGADHVSVPWKLRSAMKKRNRESVSPPFPDSEKLNPSIGGVASPKKVGGKKSKLNSKLGGPKAPNLSMKQSVCGPITKEEEEVVETLYAMAGMFPDNQLDSKTASDSASLDASPSALPEDGQNDPLQLEDSVGIKEDLNAICLSTTNEAVNSASDKEKSHEETVKFNSLIMPSIYQPSDFPSCQRELDSSDAHVNLHEPFVKHEEQKSSSNGNYCFPLEKKEDTGKLKQPAKLEIQRLEMKPEIALGQITVIGSQLDQESLINESKTGCPAFWPGLASTVSDPFTSGPLRQSFPSKIPAWLGNTTRRCPMQSDSATGTVSKDSIGRRSWKRCAAHVYISHVIQALEIPENKESLQLHPNQPSRDEILKQGLLMTLNDFNDRNDLNGVTSPSSIIKKIEKNSGDANSDSIQHPRPRQDHLQLSLSCGAYSSQKQNFNFLSLSAGGRWMENNNSLNGARNGLEPSTQKQVAYHAQHSTHMPFSMPQAQYASAYANQSAAAASRQAQHQLQLAHHFRSPYSGPHASPQGSTKEQQQQQRLLAAQLAAQYRNTVTSTAMTRFPSWQNGLQDSPERTLYISPSPPTLELLGQKYP